MPAEHHLRIAVPLSLCGDLAPATDTDTSEPSTPRGQGIGHWPCMACPDAPRARTVRTADEDTTWPDGEVDKADLLAPLEGSIGASSCGWLSPRAPRPALPRLAGADVAPPPLLPTLAVGGAALAPLEATMTLMAAGALRATNTTSTAAASSRPPAFGGWLVLHKHLAIVQWLESGDHLGASHM
jgi:hypothetical protein